MNRALALVMFLCACDSSADDSKAAPKADAKTQAKVAELAKDAAVKTNNLPPAVPDRPDPVEADDPAPEAAKAAEGEEKVDGPVLDQTVKTIKGEDKNLSDYRGKALLVVNTASQCGYTPQYEGLQELYAKYKEKGFEVLAFPSNDFGAQEPGSADEIASFVDDKYGVQFAMFAKVPVKGDAKVPLYTMLTEQTPEGIKGEIKWNFTKFLVDPDGRVIARFEPNVDPMDADLTGKLEAVLPKAG